MTGSRMSSVGCTGGQGSLGRSLEKVVKLIRKLGGFFGHLMSPLKGGGFELRGASSFPVRFCPPLPPGWVPGRLHSVCVTGG